MKKQIKPSMVLLVNIGNLIYRLIVNYTCLIKPLNQFAYMIARNGASVILDLSKNFTLSFVNTY